MILKKPSNFKFKAIILFFVLFLSVCVVAAHQPRVDIGTTTSPQDPIIVENPEISQAFYGNLKGTPDYYQITSDKPFEMYLNILVPASPGLGGTLPSVEVTDSSGKIILTMNGTTGAWTPYFEEFGGDYYLKGPEVTKDVPAGTYNIKVFNADNRGKYSLAIGKIEAFPADESLNAIISLPILKEQFFGKPVTELFLEFLGIILALGTTMVLFIMFILSRKSREIAEITAKVGGVLKPVMWLGIAITGLVWTYVMFQNPLNIIGLVNSLVLIIILVLTALLSSKISKIEFGRVPIISTTILVLFWWLFVYWAITVI
ncbi:hypothetical protein [Methanobacterium sp. ACI-7]|uniref:hypothetical protein n=1 Tax=unclassified Methanobacterium TaxID=2627676 RepID=UPI0039C3F2DB